MKPVRLLHVTDPHLYADESREIYDTNSARSLRAVLRAALDARAADGILVTGDVAEDSSPGAYRNFRRALEPSGLPVWCLPGNHDAPASMAALLDDGGFQYLGRAELGDWRLVMLDTHVAGEPGGRLRTEELQRLERELVAADERPTLVALHHPPVPVGSAWIDALGLANGAAFLALLERFPAVRAVVAGHVHQAFETRRGAVRLLTSPSTCAQFTPGTLSCVMDDRPPGWRWLVLGSDGAVDTEVGWLGDWSRATRPRDPHSPAGGAMR